MVHLSSEIAQVNQMELQSGKKLPPVSNYGQNIVQELSQSKNKSSPLTFLSLDLPTVNLKEALLGQD